MDSSQLVWVVLASVLVGALIPVLGMLTVVLYRAARQISEIGRQLGPTLAHVEAVSARVDAVSRGLEGGEKPVAELVAVVGELACTLERNVRMLNVAASVVAAAGPAVAAFVKALRQEPAEVTEAEAPRTA